MDYVTSIGWVVYVGVAFVLRTFIQLRTTGSTGLVGVRRGAGMLERAAGLLFAGWFVLTSIGPYVGSPVFEIRSLATAGLVVVAAGTFATLNAQIAMRTSWRIGVDPSERTALVTRGPYRWVRNPIFTAMIATSIGLALAYPTPSALAAPVLLALALELQVRFIEEPYLGRTHGGPYLEYAGRTGRFLPGIGRGIRSSPERGADAQ